MPTPLFIVDGFTEQKIIQNICPGSPIRRTDLNGKSVTVAAISKKIASFIRLSGNRYYPIIILVDRETRDISHTEMAAQLKELIISEGIVDCDLRIGVADRMIENWILADWESLTKKPPAKIEDCNGASTLRKIIGNYDKTTDGVRLFINAKQETIYNRCQSYKHFVDQIVDLKCLYIQFLK